MTSNIVINLSVSAAFLPQSLTTRLWFSWENKGFVCSDILGSLEAVFPQPQLHELIRSLPPHLRYSCSPYVS